MKILIIIIMVFLSGCSTMAMYAKNKPDVNYDNNLVKFKQVLVSSDHIYFIGENNSYSFNIDNSILKFFKCANDNSMNHTFYIDKNISSIDVNINFFDNKNYPDIKCDKFGSIIKNDTGKGFIYSVYIHNGKKEKEINPKKTHEDIVYDDESAYLKTINKSGTITSYIKFPIMLSIGVGLDSLIFSSSISSGYKILLELMSGITILCWNSTSEFCH